MSRNIDVTDKMRFDNPDDELLPITRCVCGEEFISWDFIISIYDDEPYSCDKCGRKFFFRQSIRIYSVEE